MNLHIVPDNVFINKFYENLRELQILNNNKLIVRTNRAALKYVRHDLPFAPLYTSRFNSLTGDTGSYEKVFIHQFTPLMYRWVSVNNFHELNWMIWGSDLYNLPFLDAALYEPHTRKQYIRRTFTVQSLLYHAKVFALHHLHRKKAYSKVKNVLTWMRSEYEFALEHLPGLQAEHQFFFYENETPYVAIDEILRETPPRGNRRPAFILGNSSTPELNHLDAVRSLESQGVEADLWIPLSYGDERYRSFLKKALSFYKGGEVRFIEEYMEFRQYLRLLNSADGLIMNNIRPQGYGNIFMMMYLGKSILLNKKNLSIRELEKSDLLWASIDSFHDLQKIPWTKNRSAVTQLLSHDILLKTYANLF